MQPLKKSWTIRKNLNEGYCIVKLSICLLILKSASKSGNCGFIEISARVQCYNRFQVVGELKQFFTIIIIVIFQGFKKKLLNNLQQEYRTIWLEAPAEIIKLILWHSNVLGIGTISWWELSTKTPNGSPTIARSLIGRM